MRNKNSFKWITSAIFATALALPAQAGFSGSNQCLADVAGAGSALNCTGGDIGINSIKIMKVIDGCVSSKDTALVEIDIELDAHNTRYDVGVYIDLLGGDANTPGNTCFHDALFPVTTGTTNKTSGIGPFLDNDSDMCGDMIQNDIWNKTLVDGDVSGGSTTAATIEIRCSDNDSELSDGQPNGYVDMGWAVSWAQNANGINCQSVADAIAGNTSKCRASVSDTKNATGLAIPLGVPDLSVAITCSPTNVAFGETVSCTATYNNASALGAADYMKFKVNYPGKQGTISNIQNQGVGETNSDDTTNDYINWGMSGGQVAQNIPVSTTNTMTFDFTYNGGPNFNISIDTFYDNGTTTESNQTLSDTVSFTTLPVTIAYVYPQKGGSGISLDFSTSSETSNIGFNVYAIEGKVWTKLNDEIIPGALDSFEPRDYHVDLAVPSGLDLKKIGIAGVTNSGTEDRHGPFKVGRVSGAKAVVMPVDWKKVHSQIDKKRKDMAKKAKKKIAKDKVYNLEVSEDAVYRVTHDALKDSGLNLIKKKSKEIAVSFRGEGVARHIGGLDKQGKWSADSWIEFLGSAPKGSDALYLDTNLYQLSLGSSLVVESDAIAPLTVKTIIVEENNRYSYSLPQEDPFYDAGFYARGTRSGTLTRNFEMPALAEGRSTLTVQLSGYTRANHKVIIALNGTQIASESSEGWVDWPIEISIDNSMIEEGNNQLTLTIPSRNGIFDYQVYDKFTLAYGNDEPLDSLNPKIVISDKILTEDIEPKSGINYLIVAHPLFLGATLDRYAGQKEGEGWESQIVNVEDIYATYGYGMATPDAIKSYLDMAKNRGVTHVQLVGAANYDYHNYLKTAAVSLIPSMYAVTAKIIHYTPCDACLVLDESEVPALAIGRWPVRTLEGLEAVVNKSLAWENTGQSSTHTALFIADETNKGMNFGHQMDGVAQKFEANGWEDLTRVYLDNLITENGGDIGAAVNRARAQIDDAFSAGVSVTSYSGHSSPSVWSFKGLLRQSDIASIDNKGKTTMALPLACFATYADSPYVNTMAHQLLVAGENGAVAVYGSSTTSYYGDNEIASKMTIDGLLDGKTIGTAVKEMKHSLGARYRDVIRSGNLQGDVTLKLK